MAQSAVGPRPHSDPRHFRRYLPAQVLTQVGNGITQFATILALTELAAPDELPWLLAANLAASYLPYLALGPIAGIVADRVSRPALLIWGDALRGVLTAALLFAIMSGSVWGMLVVVLAHASVGAFYEAARFAVVPLLVPRAELRAANGYMQVSYTFGHLLGPALVGLSFLSGLGFGVLVLDVIAFAVSAIVMATLREPLHAVPSTRRARSARLEVRELIGLLRTPSILWTFGGVALANLFSGSLSSYLPSLLASQGVNAASAGFVLSGGAAGLLLALILRRRAFEWKHAPSLGLVLRGAALISLIAAPDGALGLLVAIALWAASTLGSTMFQSGATSVRQLAARPEEMSRVGSLSRMIGWSTLPLSGFLAGAVISVGGIDALFILAGVVSLALAVAMRRVWEPPSSRNL